jgi:predicted amidohydrolase
MTRTLEVALLQLRAFDLAQHREAWADLLRRIDEAAALSPHPDLIVLPEASYPAYFLHSRETYDAAGVLPDDEVLAVLGERARRHGTSIAAGLVLHGAPGTPAEGRLENVAVLFGPDGAVRGRTPKAFLWHFDSQWFAPGVTHGVFDVAQVRAGMLVCADARLPEIARSLAVGGAEVIVDCTAWVSSGRDPATLSTPQVDYLIPARAIENRTWIVAADKCGPEADTLVYAGRSGVCDPDGRWVAQAPSDRPGIVSYTIDLDAPRRAAVDRRPELYGDAATAGADSRATTLAREAIVAEGGAARVAAVSMETSPSAVDLIARVRALVRSLAEQGSRLIVLPDLSGSDPRGLSQQELLPLLQALSLDTRTLIVALMAERTDGATYRTAYLLGSGEVLAAHRQTHISAREEDTGFAAGDEVAPVVPTSLGNIALAAGTEGLVPEVMRGLKLRGAEIIAWPTGDLGVPLRMIARARANEERAYIVGSGDTTTAGGGYIIDPTGMVIGETLAGHSMAMSADVHRMLTRWNDMAPGTNPVRDRDPEAFRILFE